MATLIGARPSNRSRDTYDRGNRTTTTRHEIIYAVQTSGDERDEAAKAAITFAIGDSWSDGTESMTESRCYDIDADEISEHIWDVTASFETTTPDTAGTGQPPELLTPEWSWTSETEEVVITKDVETGDLIQNSADQPLFITAPVPLAVLSISRYQTTFDQGEIYDNVAHCNQGVFWGRPERSVLCAGISDNPVDIDGRRLRQVNYTFKFRSDAAGLWVAELLDQGTRYDSDPPNNTWKIFEDNGVPTTGNLQADGNQKTAGEEFKIFRYIERANFNSLQLGPW